MDVSIRISPHTMRSLKRVQTLLEQLQPEMTARALVVPGSLEPGRSIIVFPGSFNPPTRAHLALLREARQFARLHGSMQVYAAMSTYTVDKETVERPLVLDRVLLLDRLLRRRLPGTGMLLCNRGLYVEQAEAVRGSFSRVKRLLFLMGFDKVVQILDPRYYDDRDAALYELFALAELLVAPRGDTGEESLEMLLGKAENQPFAGCIHALPFSAAYRGVSSSQIRQYVGTYLDDVPREVRHFMRETRAYAEPLRLPDGSVVDYYGERVKVLEALRRDSDQGADGRNE